MIRQPFAIIISLCALISNSLGQVGEEVDQALRGEIQGIPQVSIAKLSSLLSGLSSKDPRRTRILRELGLSYFAAGQLTEALHILQSPELSSDSIARFWLAQSLAAQGEFGQALPLYQGVLATNSDLKPYAALGLVRSFRALGKDKEALAALTDFSAQGLATPSIVIEHVSILLEGGRIQDAAAILDANPTACRSSWGQYLLARIAMFEGRWSSANSILDKIRPENDSLVKDILLGQAECLIQLGDLSSAENLLSKFIQEYPQHAALPVLFAKLDEVYKYENSPSSGDLRRWAEDADHPFRAGYAHFYCARNDLRVSRTESAMGLFREFLRDLPLHPLADATRVELAQQYLRSNKAQDALDVLAGFHKNLSEDKEKQVDFLRGRAFFALNRYTEAADAFLSAAHKDSTGKAETVLYNAALSSLLAGEPPARNLAREELLRRYPEGHAAQELKLVEALRKAKSSAPDAPRTLQSIANASPRARLALAEQRFVANDLPGAVAEWLQLPQSSDVQGDRASYLAVFLADDGSEQAQERVTRLARNFLNTYPNSVFKPDVRMKLGEVFFRNGNFVGARVQFESLAREFSDSSLTEPALFFAAQSSARLMDSSGTEDAMLMFEEVAKMGGSFALRARLEQAQLQEASGHSDQALLILENILASQPSPEIRFEALMTNGNILFGQGRGAKENYFKAVEAWRQISNFPGVSVAWKNQALTKIGAAYQKLQNTEQALASYYDVFSTFRPTDPEFFWFYKAGFDAGKLLESKQRWNEAIVVYKQIAAVSGPRAEEAKDRMERIRREHLIGGS